MMPIRQKIFAFSLAIIILVTIFELVRKRKLREEYSWLWLLTGAVVLLLVIWYDLLLFMTRLIGAVAPTTTLFIFGIVFLMFISLHFAIKISSLSNQVKNLAQKLSLLEAEGEGKGDT